MPIYLHKPQFKVTVGSTTYVDRGLSGRISRFENGFDVGTCAFSDPRSHDRDLLVKGVAINIYVKDIHDSAYQPLLTGITRYRTETLSEQGEQIVLKCDGAGYGFAETLCAQEYGSQSSNAILDTMKEILTNTSYGIVPKYVNKILGSADDSGYTYDSDDVDTITGDIKYLYFPYKPCSKSVTDVCNLVQAIKGASAGPHWIITPAGKILVSTVGTHSAAAIAAGWPTYMGGTLTDATLTQGIDFEGFTFENLTSEANYILYHSNWVWPANGDLDDLSVIGDWTSYLPNLDLAYDTTNQKVGTNCVTATWNAVAVLGTFGYQSAGSPIHLDLTKAGGKFNIPTFGFWCKRNTTFILGASPDWLVVNFYSPFSGIFEYFYCGVDLARLLIDPDKWYYVEFPVGPYWRTPDASGSTSGFFQTAGAVWSDICYITFECNYRAQNSVFSVDGVHFAGYVLRGAKNSTKIAADKLKMRVVNDPFGKDDTLNTDDTGTVSRLAYAELLRAQTTPTIGTFTTAMIPAAVPGQLVHVHARPNRAGTYQIDADFRITQLVHEFNGNAAVTKFCVTSDVVNSVARAAYDSVNEVKRSERPEFQDRQATGIKMREIDVTQSVLEKDYPS
jgi:hypothetical protein